MSIELPLCCQWRGEAEARLARLEEALSSLQQSAHTANAKGLRNAVLEITETALAGAGEPVENKDRERWRRLVNAIADKFTGGLVVGDDDMAVAHAISHVKQAADAADIRERAAMVADEYFREKDMDENLVSIRIRALSLTEGKADD